MATERVISDAELGPADGTGLAGRARQLLAHQKATWPLLRKNYAGLAGVRIRALEFDGFSVQLQFNPGRIVSTAASIDEKTIRERPCFLCHLPPEQRALAYAGEYLILCNPFPIFSEHFTIPGLRHVPQRIAGGFGLLLDLSRELAARYTVFYNGPKSGASAPDHMHFQAGEKGFMPVDDDYPRLRARLAQPLAESDALRAYRVDGYLRPFIAFESANRLALLRAFEVFYAAFEPLSTANDEPSMNVLGSFEGGAWRIIIFPRARHRPSCFFAEGDGRILLSPGAVDLGGTCITPLEADFEKITREDLVRAFAEVCIAPDQFSRLCTRLAAELCKL